MVVQWFVPRFPDADGFKACVDTATKIKQAVPTQIDVDAQPASDFTAESANWAEVAVATINRCLQGGFNRPMSMSPREMALIDVDGNSPLGQNYKTRSKNAEKLDREMEKAREEAKAQVALGEAVGDEEDDGGDDQPTQTGEQSAAEASSAADEVAAAKKARKFKTPYDETLCAADFGARRLPKGVYVVLQEGPPNMLTGVRPPQIAWSIRQDAEGRLASQWNVPPAFPDADAVFSAFSNRLASLGHRLAVQKSKSYDKYIFTKALFDQARDDVLQFATSRDVVNTLRLRRVPSRLRERRVQGRMETTNKEDHQKYISVIQGGEYNVEPPDFDCKIPVTLKTADLVEIPRTNFRHRWVEYILHRAYLAGLGGREDLLATVLESTVDARRRVRDAWDWDAFHAEWAAAARDFVLAHDQRYAGKSPQFRRPFIQSKQTQTNRGVDRVVIELNLTYTFPQIPNCRETLANGRQTTMSVGLTFAADMSGSEHIYPYVLDAYGFLDNPFAAIVVGGWLKDSLKDADADSDSGPVYRTRARSGAAGRHFCRSCHCEMSLNVREVDLNGKLYCEAYYYGLNTFARLTSKSETGKLFRKKMDAWKGDALQSKAAKTSGTATTFVVVKPDAIVREIEVRIGPLLKDEIAGLTLDSDNLLLSPTFHQLRLAHAPVNTESKIAEYSSAVGDAHSIVVAENLVVTSYGVARASTTDGPEMLNLILQAFRLKDVDQHHQVSPLVRCNDNGVFPRDANEFKTPLIQTQGRPILDIFSRVEPIRQAQNVIPYKRADRITMTSAQIEESIHNVKQTQAHAKTDTGFIGATSYVFRPTAAAVASLIGGDRDRLRDYARIVEEMEEELHEGKFRLPRTPDGVPFFLLGEDARKWNARKIVAFGRKKFNTTLYYCNARFVIDEFADHWTHLIGMARDAIEGHGLCEGTHMPLTAQYRHPFSLSLGKRRHGENMVSGARRHKPTKNADFAWEYRHQGSESKAFNMAKSNATYEQIDAWLRELMDAPEPTIARGPTIPSASASLTRVPGMTSIDETARQPRARSHGDTEKLQKRPRDDSSSSSSSDVKFVSQKFATASRREATTSGRDVTRRALTQTQLTFDKKPDVEMGDGPGPSTMRERARRRPELEEDVEMGDGPGPSTTRQRARRRRAPVPDPDSGGDDDDVADMGGPGPSTLASRASGARRRVHVSDDEDDW